MNPAEAAAVHRAVTLLSMAAFVSSIALRMCDSMLPALVQEFAVTAGQAAVVVTGTSVAYGICQLLFGPLGDRFGKFRVIALACLGSTLAAAACAVSGTLDSLVIARAFNGATTAALIPLSMAWIGDVVPFEQRQPTLARFMSGQMIGLITGQVLGGVVADTVGWRWGFAVLAGTYAAVGWLLVRALATVPGASGHGAGAVQESTLQRMRRVAQSRTARFVLGIVLVEAMFTFGVMAFIPAYLHYRFHISLSHAGGLVAAFGVGGLCYALFARRWVRALGQTGLAVVGGSLVGLAFVALALGNHWVWGLVACVVYGLGFYQLHNTLQTQATQMAPQARGTAVSIFAATFFLGQATGVSVAAWVVDHYGARWLFVASAIVVPVLGVVLRNRLRRAESA